MIQIKIAEKAKTRKGVTSQGVVCRDVNAGQRGKAIRKARKVLPVDAQRSVVVRVEFIADGVVVTFDPTRLSFDM